MTTPALTREQVREQVRTLLKQGLSDSAIGRLLGMPSRHTVARWRTEWNTEQPTAHPDAPTCAPPCAPGPSMLAVAVTDDLREDLAVLAEAGLPEQDALAYALRLVADGYRSAWDYGDVARGTRPRLRIQITGGHRHDAPETTGAPW